MKQQPQKTTLKNFVQEFELRKQFTYALSNLDLKQVKDFRTARQVMLN